MSSYKLTYFNARGRAEASRLIFAYAGVPFVDCRKDWDEWKTKEKSSAKFGVLPSLEFDGKTFTQSRAMAYYLAKEFGLYATDNIGGLHIDEVVFIVEDFTKAFYKARFAPVDKKEEMLKTFQEEDTPKFLGWLEKLLIESGTGYFYKDKMTLADIVVFDFLDNMARSSFGTVPDDYKHVQELQGKVANHPAIKKYLDSRPKTDF